MSKIKFPIIRNGRAVDFKSETGQVVQLTARDSLKGAWYMQGVDGHLLKIAKAAVPTVIVGGVSYSYVAKPRVVRHSQHTLDAANLSADLKKIIGKDLAKLEEVGKKLLADVLASKQGQRLKLDLGNGFQLVIGKPASAFKKMKATTAA